MSSRHVFDNPDGLVLKSLRGAVALNPALRLHAASKTVYTVANSPQARVAIISGGGAGHEPAHASYTGNGMLAASVSGDIFASPSASQVLTAIRLGTTAHWHVGRDAKPHPRTLDSSSATQTLDTLLVVNNYTGDRLNFGLAAERARALGLRVSSVVVADDVSLLSRPTPVGPRGLAGNIIVCKVLGAAAARGMGLDELKRLGDAAVGSLRSIGASLYHCHVPGRTKHGDEAIGVGEYELGMGLHNEPGVKRLTMEGGSKVVEQMLAHLLPALSATEPGSQRPNAVDISKDTVVLFVNNLGGISQLELGAVVDEVVSQLATANIYPARIYSSSFMTSLNAPGFSISVLNISAIHRNLLNADQPSSTGDTIADVLAYLDDPTDANAWSNINAHWPRPGSPRDMRKEEDETDALVQSLISMTASRQQHDASEDVNNEDMAGNLYDALVVERAIRSACASVLSVEPDLTRFDTVLGDGDCGETFASGAKALTGAIDDSRLKLTGRNSSQLVADVATILEGHMGGTSGALFGLYFTALSNTLARTASGDAVSSAAKAWKSSSKAALEALSAHTPARPGDRTLVDALHPFCHALAAGESLTDAAAKAKAGAVGTKEMVPRLGRATYVVDGRDEDLGSLPPDPGAWGVAAIIEGLRTGLEHAETGRYADGDDRRSL